MKYKEEMKTNQQLNKVAAYSSLGSSLETAALFDVFHSLTSAKKIKFSAAGHRLE